MQLVIEWDAIIRTQYALATDTLALRTPWSMGQIRNGVEVLLLLLLRHTVGHVTPDVDGKDIEIGVCTTLMGFCNGLMLAT